MASHNTIKMTCLLSRTPRIDVAKQDLDGPVHRFTDLISGWSNTLRIHALGVLQTSAYTDSTEFCHARRSFLVHRISTQLLAIGRLSSSSLSSRRFSQRYATTASICNQSKISGRAANGGHLPVPAHAQGRGTITDCVPGVKPEQIPLSRRVTLQLPPHPPRSQNPTEPLVNAVQASPQMFWVRDEQKVTVVTYAERGARGLGRSMKVSSASAMVASQYYIKARLERNEPRGGL